MKKFALRTFKSKPINEDVRYYTDEDKHLKIEVSRPAKAGGIMLLFPYITSDLGSLWDLVVSIKLLQSTGGETREVKIPIQVHTVQANLSCLSLCTHLT